VAVGTATYKPCRDGNGISMENSGRVEDVHLGRQRLPPELQQRRLHRQPRRLHAKHRDQQQVPQQRLRRAGRALVGARQAPYGDGFGVYHDSTVVNPAWLQ
jgi:hypothetical protein